MMSLLACWGQSLGRVKLLNPALQDDGFKRGEIPETKKQKKITWPWMFLSHPSMVSHIINGDTKLILISIHSLVACTNELITHTHALYQ